MPMIEDFWIALDEMTHLPPDGDDDLMILRVADRKADCALMMGMEGWIVDVMLYEVIRSSNASRSSFGLLGFWGTVVDAINLE